MNNSLFCHLFLILHCSNYMLFHSLGNMTEDNGMARSIFLSALMVTSVMTGLLFFDIEDEGVNDLQLLSLMSLTPC